MTENKMKTYRITKEKRELFDEYVRATSWGEAFEKYINGEGKEYNTHIAPQYVIVKVSQLDD